MGLEPAIYRPRDAEHTVLHQVISEHLETFLDAVAEAGDAVGLPQFVEREFRELLTCVVFEDGVARFRCEGCRREHLVPFSCKRRGWCPSCGGRRMTERAAHPVHAREEPSVEPCVSCDARAVAALPVETMAIRRRGVVSDRRDDLPRSERPSVPHDRRA